MLNSMKALAKVENLNFKSNFKLSRLRVDMLRPGVWR